MVQSIGLLSAQCLALLFQLRPCVLAVDSVGECIELPLEACETPRLEEVSLLQTEIRVFDEEKQHEQERKQATRLQPRQLKQPLVPQPETSLTNSTVATEDDNVAMDIPYGNFALLEFGSVATGPKKLSMPHLQLRQSAAARSKSKSHSSSIDDMLPPEFVFLLLGLAVGVIATIAFVIARMTAHKTADKGFAQQLFAPNMDFSSDQNDSKQVGTANATTMSSTSLPSSPTSWPPPICPTLILPKTEARLLIAVSSLHDPKAEMIDIVSTSQKKLLTLSIGCQADGGKFLSISSTGTEDDPRASVYHTKDESSTPVLRIDGKRGAPYGILKEDASLARLAPDSHVYILHYDGQPALQVKTTGDALTDFVASAPGDWNAVLARASLEADTWKIQITAGADGILMMSCFLGLMLLKLPRESQSQ